MRRRSFAARVIGLGLFMSAPAGLQAQTSRPDLSTLMRTVGYTFANKNASDQINHVVGMEVGATQRLTLIADVVGRSFLDTLQLRPNAVTVVSPGDPAHGIPPVTSEAFATVEPQNGTLRSILGTAGLKFNPTGSILISAHVIATISDAGLRRSLTPVLGFDHSF